MSKFDDCIAKTSLVDQHRNTSENLGRIGGNVKLLSTVLKGSNKLGGSSKVYNIVYILRKSVSSFKKLLGFARGPKKHLKRVAAPKHWMLDKLTGVFSGYCSAWYRGGHYSNFSYCWISDVISIDKTGENFRLIYDTKGRFAVHRITPEEAKYKLCKVRKIFVGTKGIPHLVTHDARTIRYPDPLIKVNDTIQIDLETGKITDFIKFDTGNLCMVTGGANLGRIGVITNRERHPGSFDVVHVKDANGNSFATRLSNIFVIGKGNKPWISLPRGKGIRLTIAGVLLTIAEERDKRLAAKQSSG
ncbi:LOW QUALITY PROTEIN: 40S ribosomal protein S4, X isoform [Tupaia chinensis]|uniref:LOW QUALITY PROTEIN: 40S ribosomal protein S4, X isoform n=1 Tax=Tupaia chinensis TaxID=246437 RepID=UPI000FFB4F3D|nr:LOW QUALITY PROTEIN: 40S ribosomal protein S4, X isoform [Tupaia chinensis]